MIVDQDEDSIFLLQLPSYVVERWKAADSGALGTLSVDPTQATSVKIRLHGGHTFVVGEYAEDLPKEYVGNVSHGRSKLFLMEDEQICTYEIDVWWRLDGCVVFEAVSGPLLHVKTRVEKKLNLKTGRLELDENVARLAKEKNAQERKKAKMMMTQEISLADGRDKKHPLLSTIKRKNHVVNLDETRNKKEKRARSEKGDLEIMLFGLFESRKRWTLPALQKRTRQPTTWLKEVLNGIAVLNRAGPNLGTYELKPEFVQD